MKSKFDIHIIMNRSQAVRITFALQIDLHAPVTIDTVVRVVDFLNLCLYFCFLRVVICLPVFPIVVVSIRVYLQPPEQPTDAKYIMIFLNKSISL